MHRAKIIVFNIITFLIPSHLSFAYLSCTLFKIIRSIVALII